MGEHARIGPSSLARVKRCPGSVRATEGMPRRTTEAAAEGTVLHDIAADCLEHGFEPEDYIGRTMSADGYSFEMGLESGQTDPTCMIEALDWIREQPGIIFIEYRVLLDPWMPGQFGTLDVGIYDPATGLATVFDWKFGAGILVELVNNYQVRGYGIGFLKFLREQGYPDPKAFRFIIEQPRCSGAPRFWDHWEISTDELLQFGEEMAEIWAAANDPNAPRIAGLKQCYFCDAKLKPEGCAEHTEFMFDLVSQKFEDADEGDEPDLPDHGSLTPERRTWIVRHKSMFTSWLEQLSASILDDAINGRATPGLKAVEGDKGHRYYKDEEAAEAILVGALAADAFTKKLKSPAQAEKVMKPGKRKPGHPEAWEDLNKLIGQPDGKPILVSEDDPRPRKQTVDEKFDENDDDLI